MVVVVTASDLAGNQALREVRLRDLLSASAPLVQMPSPPSSPAPLPTSVSAKVDLPKLEPLHYQFEHLRPKGRDAKSRLDDVKKGLGRK